MIIYPPTPAFISRKRNPRQFGPPPAAPTLVAAEYIAFDGEFLRLTFDRAIDVAGMVGSQIVVDDADNLGQRFAATGAVTVEAPARILIVLVQIGDATGTGTTLDAGAGNGITAVDDGVAWAGVSGVALPFP